MHDARFRTGIPMPLALFCTCAIGVSAPACASDDPDSAGQCTDCPVTLETIIELDFSDAPAGPTSPLSEDVLARVPGTDQWLFAHGSDLLLLALDDARAGAAPTGRFVRRIGRAGGGPGEHGSIRGLRFDDTDSLFVADDENRRIDVHAPDLTLARSIPIEVPFYHFDLLRDGRILVGPNVAGMPPFDRFRARVVERDGTMLQVAEARSLEDPQDRLYAFVAVNADDTGFRISRPFEYKVLRYDTDGMLVDSVVGMPAWFVPADYSDPLYQQLGIEESRPTITGLMTDGAGLLWIRTTMPVTTDSLPEDVTSLRSAGPAAFIRFAGSVLDYAVEAVDPDTGARVAAQVFTEPIHFIGDGYAYQPIVDPVSGAINVRIVRLGGGQ